MSSAPLVPCHKRWHSAQDQLAKLSSRGLVISDPVTAATVLRHINYYCFTGYGLVFEKPRHSYIPGTTFEQIREAYDFDRALRDLFTESIELIELDLRTTLAHTFGEVHSAFGHTLPANFYDKDRHALWLQKIREETKRSSDLFIIHHRNKYLEFPDIPIWVAVEIMSFGSLSNFYRSLAKDDQKRVSSRYGLQPHILGSWIHHLVYVRNLCAHHARLWDRRWSIKPDLPAGKLWAPPSIAGNAQLFASLLIQSTLLRPITPESAFITAWRSRAESLLTLHLPACPDALKQMGLPTDWARHPLWS
jgi:abortive infection bacteriophage resistance protein